MGDWRIVFCLCVLHWIGLGSLVGTGGAFRHDIPRTRRGRRAQGTTEGAVSAEEGRTGRARNLHRTHLDHGGCLVSTCGRSPKFVCWRSPGDGVLNLNRTQIRARSSGHEVRRIVGGIISCIHVRSATRSSVCFPTRSGPGRRFCIVQCGDSRPHVEHPTVGTELAIGTYLVRRQGPLQPCVAIWRQLELGRALFSDTVAFEPRSSANEGLRDAPPLRHYLCRRHRSLGPLPCCRCGIGHLGR